MPTSFPKYKLPGAATTIVLVPNSFKKLTFNAAPAVMEFGISIGAGTDPVVLTGDTDADTLKATLEACADLEGYSVAVYGSTIETGVGADGAILHSGVLIVTLQGTAPYPSWGTVQNAEVQSFVVEDGDEGGYQAIGAGSSQYNALYQTRPSRVAGRPTFRSPANLWLARYTSIPYEVWALGPGIDDSHNAAYFDGSQYIHGGVWPALTGWNRNTGGPNAGDEPAPSFARYGEYTWNSSDGFLLGGETATEIQAYLRALSGDYANVIVQGWNRSGVLAGSTGTSTFAWNNISNIFDGNDMTSATSAGPGWYSGTLTCDRGSNAKPMPVCEGYLKANIGEWTAIETSQDGTNWTPLDFSPIDASVYTPPLYDFPFSLNTPGIVLRYVRFSVTNFGGTLFGIELMTPIVFNSYFPYTAGNIANPSATGTNATVSTSIQSGSESELVIATECDLETLLRMTLKSPLAAPAAPGFTPASNEHWQDTPPATVDEAIHRTAYAMNELFWEQVP